MIALFQRVSFFHDVKSTIEKNFHSTTIYHVICHDKKIHKMPTNANLQKIVLIQFEFKGQNYFKSSLRGPINLLKAGNSNQASYQKLRELSDYLF